MIAKKLGLMALALCIGAGIVFAGGGGQSTGASSAANGKQPILLGIQSNSFITDYKNNYLTQYMENLHNINLDFYMLPEPPAEFRTKISLMVSSWDLPDLIFTNGSLTNEQILDYGSKGAFIPLNKYLNDPVKAPNFAKIPAEDKAIIFDTCVSSDGNIYGLPRFEIETRNLTPFWIHYNKAWADKLGIKPPTTTAELKSMLIAFRDLDPNGNGRKDEIGLYCWYNGGFGEDTITAILNYFVFYNKNNLALDASGNRVIAPFIDPAFRKGLAYLNDLYKEGVLAASSFTDDQAQFRATLNTVPPIVGFTSAGFTNHWPDSRTNANYLELAMIPPLTGPDGVSWVPYTGYIPSKAGFITSKARNPDLAFQFADSFFDKDVSSISRFGEPEVDWTRKPEELTQMTSMYVAMGLFPALTIVDKTNLWSFPNNKMWHGANPRWAWTGEAETKGYAYSPYDPTTPGANNGGIDYQYNRLRHPEHILPPLLYSIDDATKNAEIITNINSFVQQAVAEFTTGARDINNDSHWNAYLRELNNQGLQQWLDSAQTTYDRQK
jgi:putative aldouronate transport system substrate-binding protein